MSVVFQGVSKDDLAPPATRASKRAAKKAHEALLQQAEKEQLRVSRQDVEAIIAAVCLAHGIHRTFLLRAQKGKCESKRSHARATLAVLIQELVPQDDKKTRALIACKTMMSYQAMQYCLTQGRWFYERDETYRQKVDTMLSSLRS